MLKKHKNALDILLVENDESDEVLITQRLSQVLPDASVHVVDSVEQARNVYKDQNLDVIFLDLNLRDSTGYDTVKQINAFNKHRLPVLIVTGTKDDNVIRQSFKHGATDIILKCDISNDDFVDVFREYIS